MGLERIITDVLQIIKLTSMTVNRHNGKGYNYLFLQWNLFQKDLKNTMLQATMLTT